MIKNACAFYHRIFLVCTVIECIRIISSLSGWLYSVNWWFFLSESSFILTGGWLDKFFLSFWNLFTSWMSLRRIRFVSFENLITNGVIRFSTYLLNADGGDSCSDWTLWRNNTAPQIYSVGITFNWLHWLWMTSLIPEVQEYKWTKHYHTRSSIQTDWFTFRSSTSSHCGHHYSWSQRSDKMMPLCVSR